MGFTVIIPARYASARLPGKALAPIAGRPLIAHVVDRARGCGAARVLVATDDERIRRVVEPLGVEVCMTADTHRSGTERLAEVVERKGLPPEEVVVNLQGDEPQMPPALIAQVAALLDSDPSVEMGTLCAPVSLARDLTDPSVVKVVVDATGHALYFSRAPIPWWRDGFGAGPGLEHLPASPAWYRHIGLYAYRAAFLARYVRYPVCELETAESLEQLRALYHGVRIRVGLAGTEPGPGVDTPEDLERLREAMGGA